jgi:bacillithiol system protein YtxJ
VTPLNVATLADPAAVDAWIAAPGARWILKHSNACPVSAAGRMEFEEYLASRAGETAAMLVVQTHRPASDRVAARLGIRHETPQAFLLRDGKVLWHASHGGITAAAMAAARAAAG